MPDEHRSLGERSTFEVRLQIGRQDGGAVAGETRGLGRSLSEQPVLGSLQTVIEVRLEPHNSIRDQSTAIQLLLHPIRGIGEHDLEPARLREQCHLPEREHAGCVHTGDAPQVDQQESERTRLRPLADPLDESPGRSEEHEAIQTEDLDTVGEPLQGGAVAGGSVDVAAERRPERYLSHEVDPTVVDREQDDREEQPHLEPGHDALRGDRQHDRGDDEVLPQR